VSEGMWFRRRRLAGRLGVVGVTRLLVFQVIQVGLFVALVQGPLAALFGGAVGTVAIVVAFGRWRGRWCTELVMLWFRYRQRRGGAGGPQGGADPRLAALGRLVPDLVMEDVPGPDGTRLGMGSDGAGWFGVLEVEAGEAGVDPPVPLSALARIAAEAGPSGVVMQVVSYAAPEPGDPAARQRRLWVAVRLDADTVAGSLVDDPERQVEVPAVLAELTRRVRRTLKRRGLGSRVLDADAAIDALVLSCDLAPADPSRHRVGPVREEWEAWHSHWLSHRCYWLRDWPDPERGTGLLATLAELPGARVSTALVLEPGDEAGDPDLRCLIRLAAPQPRIREVGELAERLTVRAGGELFPLDGEHALAVYGSAPSGGGAR
jgi:type VII secretion protein EccE